MNKRDHPRVSDSKIAELIRQDKEFKNDDTEIIRQRLSAMHRMTKERKKELSGRKRYEARAVEAVIQEMIRFFEEHGEAANDLAVRVQASALLSRITGKSLDFVEKLFGDICSAAIAKGKKSNITPMRPGA